MPRSFPAQIESSRCLNHSPHPWIQSGAGPEEHCAAIRLEGWWDDGSGPRPWIKPRASPFETRGALLRVRAGMRLIAVNPQNPPLTLRKIARQSVSKGEARGFRVRGMVPLKPETV